MGTIFLSHGTEPDFVTRLSFNSCAAAAESVANVDVPVDFLDDIRWTRRLFTVDEIRRLLARRSSTPKARNPRRRVDECLLASPKLYRLLRMYPGKRISMIEFSETSALDPETEELAQEIIAADTVVREAAARRTDPDEVVAAKIRLEELSEQYQRRR